MKNGKTGVLARFGKSPWTLLLVSLGVLPGCAMEGPTPVTSSVLEIHADPISYRQWVEFRLDRWEQRESRLSAMERKQLELVRELIRQELMREEAGSLEAFESIELQFASMKSRYQNIVQRSQKQSAKFAE